MEGQTPQGVENVPQEGTSAGYTPPPSDYAQPYQSSYPGSKVGTNRFKSTDRLVQLIALGLFLMFLGTIIITAVTTSGGPNKYDERYDDNDDGNVDADRWDNYYEDLRGYDAMHDIGRIIGNILISFGIVIVVLALFGGALINKELDKHARVTMIVMAGLILIFSGIMF
ncbi:MAG: hypothetical protein JSV09_13215 [Thermoplasmata archaeon]|nr:MAG: hypothetical protein JSV09_13215 [Thermoplasmata archaeon]